MATPRTFVMGDPQAAADTVFALLAHHGALGADGRLADDVVLVSMGDHFDYDLDDPTTAGREGLRVLRWLASHPARQVRILLGNHDAARVMELIAATDADFPAARAVARSLIATGDRDGDAAAEQRWRAEYHPRFPDLPVPSLVARDYASFSEAQRDLVIELLLAGRFDLGLAGRLGDGRDVLLTHAGVTGRELALLGLPDERRPAVLAAALAGHLRGAIDEVRADWQRGGRRPLALAPLYLAATDRVEAGGMLYHRPARRDRPGADVAWEFDAERPRRYQPTQLPVGLLQIAGHTGHRKCKRELGDGWLSDAARAHPQGGIRTLRVDGDDVRYDLGVLPPAAGVADLYLVDGELRHVPPAVCGLLELAHIDDVAT